MNKQLNFSECLKEQKVKEKSEKYDIYQLNPEWEKQILEADKKGEVFPYDTLPARLRGKIIK